MESLTRTVAKAIRENMLEQAKNDSPVFDCVVIAAAAIAALRNANTVLPSDKRPKPIPDLEIWHAGVMLSDENEWVTPSDRR